MLNVRTVTRASRFMHSGLLNRAVNKPFGSAQARATGLCLPMARWLCHMGLNDVWPLEILR